ncbi:MAG: penicillin acylase family protein [Gammaproteobacteria bacterium]|nr:MAG: penicillin acylase family protein [Gammaproteobacteria bacterium]
MKRLKIIISVTVLSLLVLSLAVYIYVNQKTPNRNQTLTIAGLTAKVEVIYDDFGVPHIYAQNDEDMYLAFGYVHAQDRLFQMDLLRRLGQGRLAELFGKEVVKLDQLFRTVQINHYTEKMMRRYSDKAPKKILDAIDAYIKGINHFIETGPTPLEFEILGVDKSTFTRNDMAAVIGFTAYSFTFGLAQDLMVTNLIQDLSDEHLEDLGIRWQKGSAKIPVNKKGIELLTRELTTIISQINPMGGIFQGSNGWAISPSKTKSGKAMLVNDPHMGFSQPSVWYEAHLVSPESEIYGHHLALVPFAFLGNNSDIAWGLTMFINDDIDLYKETINPENPNQYWAIDHWQDFEQIEETIKIKGEDDLVLKLKSSRHGPIISNAFSGFEGNEDIFLETQDQLAMWWVFYDEDNDFLEALYDLTRVKNYAEATVAVKKIHAPGLNVMYADKHGDIAWWAAAKLVKRPEHVNSSAILDGATGKDDPLGFYDFSYNPQILNPDSGALYSSNNQPADTGIGLIPGYYVPRDRAQRIAGYLFSDEKQWDADKMKSMLLDNTSPLVKKIQQITLPILAKSSAITDSDLSRSALQLFKEWDANHDPDEIAVTIFYYLKKEILRHTFKDEMGEHDYAIFEDGFLRHKTIWKVIEKQSSPWWDDVSSEHVIESRTDIIVASWNKMLHALENKFGTNINNWQWKNALKMEHAHPLGEVKPLDKIFNIGPFTAAGGNETINNLIFKLSDDDFVTYYGPSTRRIIDFGDIDNSWGINPTGQSGVVMDKHYGDQAKMFAEGKYRRQYTLKSEIVEHQKGLIVMNPE